MANRVEVPSEIATKVQFLSDRTCCVCRTPNKSVQIHHIDEDPSNNDIGNLSVLCLDCHDKTQLRGGFSRQLNPDLVKLYNNSWRDIVRAKLIPNIDLNKMEYKKEVYLEINIACTSWAIDYIQLCPNNIFAGKKETSNIWELIETSVAYNYSEEKWKKYNPLFIEKIDNVMNNIRSTLTLFPDVVSSHIKTEIIRAIRNLQSTQRLFSLLPSITSQMTIQGQGQIDIDKLFNIPFSQVITLLSHLSSEIYKELESI